MIVLHLFRFLFKYPNVYKSCLFHIVIFFTLQHKIYFLLFMFHWRVWSKWVIELIYSNSGYYVETRLWGGRAEGIPPVRLLQLSQQEMLMTRTNNGSNKKWFNFGYVLKVETSRLWDKKEIKESMMTLRFLSWTSGNMLWSLTGGGKVWEKHMRSVWDIQSFRDLFCIQVGMLSRQLNMWVGSSGERFGLNIYKWEASEYGWYLKL